MSSQPVAPASWAKASVTSLAFSENAEYLAAGSTDGSVTVYYGRLTRPRSIEDVVSREEIAGYSPNGQWIVRSERGNGFSERHVSVASTSTRSVRFDGSASAVIFSPDSRWLVTSERGAITLQSLSANRSTPVPAVTRKADIATFSPSGKLLVMEGLGADGDIRLFDLTNGAVEHVLQKKAPGRFRGFSKDERLVLATSGVELRIWDTKTGSPIGRPIMLEPLQETDDDDDGDSYVVKFSPDSRWILAGRELGTTSLYRTGGDATGPPFPLKRFASAQFSPDGKRITVLSRGAPESVWDLSTLKQVVDTDEESSFRDAGAPEPQSIAGVSRVYASSSDEHLTAALVNGSFAVIDKTGAVVAQLVGHNAPIDSAAFSPDNRLLASSDSNGSLILWDVARGRRLSRTLVGPGDDDDVFYKTAFTPDGMMLDTGVPAHPRSWIADICHRIEPGLSQGDWAELAGRVPYPWTCDQVKGTTGEDLNSRTD